MKNKNKKLLFYNDISYDEIVLIDKQIIDKNKIKQIHIGQINLRKKEIDTYTKLNKKEIENILYITNKLTE